MKRDTRFKPGISGNEAAKWLPGKSGNPAGKSKRRIQFEDAFTEALIAHGGPDEAAQLLWEAARNKEPWAIQDLCRRFAPETQSLRLVYQREEGQLDYDKLTDEQLDQLDIILQQAMDQPPARQSGEGTTEPT
jgi:hypothetical protein